MRTPTKSKQYFEAWHDTMKLRASATQMQKAFNLGLFNYKLEIGKCICKMPAFTHQRTNSNGVFLCLQSLEKYFRRACMIESDIPFAVIENKLLFSDIECMLWQNVAFLFYINLSFKSTCRLHSPFSVCKKPCPNQS